MRIKWFTYAVMIYLLVAIGWWTLLLFNKNKSEYVILKQLANYERSLSAKSIDSDFEKQKIMILGEGIFLGASLLSGIWLIYRGNRKEIWAVNQQNNFLLAITHELKSPLSSIKLILQTLGNRSLANEQKTKLIKTADTEVQRLQDLIQNLIISSDDQAKGFLVKSDVSVVKLMFDLLQEYRNRDILPEIEFVNLTGVDYKEHIDPVFFKISMKNIVDNAIKYGQQSPIQIVVDEVSDHLIIKISDQGPGITEDQKGKVFQRFYRIGNERTRKSKGTGLGLFISNKIVKAHGGTLTVEDNHPKGSIFETIIPANQ